MQTPVVAIVRYDRPLDSVRKAVDLSGGFEHLPADAKVFLKPNIVYWTRKTEFPKWGVITTSRVVEDIIVLLKEHGVREMAIGEGMVVINPRERARTPAHAFESLGYRVLERRYGVRVLNLFERPFRKVDLGRGVTLRFSADFLQSDFVVNIPVIKSHVQTIVSLGIKNLKGLLDIPSRKKCHSSDPEGDLHQMVARLPMALPPSLTLLDGIYTGEFGPLFDGKARRTDVLVASRNLLSADLTGARVLGYAPGEVPHLVHAARDQGRPADLSDVQIRGEAIEAVSSRHEHAFPYIEDESLPAPMEKMGIRGFSYRKYDDSLCTYCSQINGPVLWAVAKAWRGTPWDDVEVLTGKLMKPTPGKKKTVLLGKCIYEANRDSPAIGEMIAVKGCPPSPRSIASALRKAGIEVNTAHLEQMDKYPGIFLKRYAGRPEFDESFFKVV